MKRAMFSILTAVVLAALCGCITQHGRRPWACMGGSCAQAPENCQSCADDGTAPCDDDSGVGAEGSGHGRKHHCSICAGRRQRTAQEAAPAGPAMGAVTYPYYTTRGPRDFLAKKPASIGP